MTTILVVDPSQENQRFFQKLLESSLGYSILTTANTESAMELLAREEVDVAVFNMGRPEGVRLEEIEDIPMLYPLLPLIVLVNHGDEETASRAQLAGVSAFVPYPAVAELLPHMVDRLLLEYSQRRGLEQLLDSISRQDCTFVIRNNDDAIVSTMVGIMSRGMVSAGLCDEDAANFAGLALEEALRNALHHGNLELCSDLREEDDEAYQQLLEERRRLSPYRERKLHVTVKVDSENASFVIRDEGPGFDPSQVRDATDEEHLENVSGRGVLLMRAFMDDVVYNAAGNEVTLIKKAPIAEAG
jgi:CheY-like chemotaxis protein